MPKLITCPSKPRARKQKTLDRELQNESTTAGSQRSTNSDLALRLSALTSSRLETLTKPIRTEVPPRLAGLSGSGGYPEDCSDKGNDHCPPVAVGSGIFRRDLPRYRE